jgi:outer membrane receptor protein involved in Fe transport
MKKQKYFPFLLLLLAFSTMYSQERPPLTKIKITGTIVEKSSKQALEYATITFTNPKRPKAKTGGITNPKGEFDIDIVPGVYDITIEFISFKPIVIKQKQLQESTNLGQIGLDEDQTQLNEVVVRSNETNISIKLDKKVYSIGNDLMVKGGSVSDVLDNVPSVAVDADGTVSLRGNENVTILIDGKPSNAIDISEALRSIPADAIDKVEVITNPSARYDAEGGAGILNIIIKKGKNLGFNGSVVGTVGVAKNTGINGTFNYKTNKFNLFTSQGYGDKNRPGNTLIETDYLNPSTDSPDFIRQATETNRYRKTYNGSLGIELYLTNTASWTNSITYRNNKGENNDIVNYNYEFYDDSSLDYTKTRNNFEDTKSEDINYVSSFQKKFKKEGHTLNLDVQISNETDDKQATIIDSESGTDLTYNNQKQNHNLLQADYVLPVNKESKFEAGYRGSFSNLLSDVVVYEDGVLNTSYTNELEYIEKVNALYTQFGSKFNKLSYLFGLRWEDSKIEVNQLTTSDYNPKKYNDFFPSVFFTYEMKDESNFSLNYSRRINRPRGRMINPFSNYSSNINLFYGNPDLNPAMTNAIDFGYLKKWSKFILSSSIYANITSDAFQIVSKESGEYVDGVPVIITTPINLATEKRYGFEFNLNYTPYKWWRLNSNFNFFNVITNGDYTYTDYSDEVVYQNFDNNTNSWSAKLSSKITLPKKIDWQTSINYKGQQKTSQSTIKSIFVMNTGFSKDLMKDKATLAFNVNDVFNTRKRRTETTVTDVTHSNNEMQFSERQFTLSFTYRFNKKKAEKEKQKQPNGESGEDSGGEEF